MLTSMGVITVNLAALSSSRASLLEALREGVEKADVLSAGEAEAWLAAATLEL